jgi:hypothetical protein
LLECADSCTRLGYPHIASFVSDYPEQCLFTLVKQDWCPRCELLPELFPGFGARAIRRSVSRYSDMTQQESKTVGQWKLPFVGLARGHTDFEPHQCIHPDRLHQLLTGSFKPHALSWVIGFLSTKYGSVTRAKREIDRCFSLVPGFTGLQNFGSRITKVSQWTGAEYKDMVKVWIPALAPLFSGYPQHLAFLQHLTSFIHLSGYHSHTQTTLGYMQEALDGVKSGFHLWADYRPANEDPNCAHIPTIHFMDHYIETIKDMGTADNSDTEFTEATHRWLCKNAYRTTNKVDYIPQILAWKSRLFYIKARISILRYILERDPNGRHAAIARMMLVYDVPDARTLKLPHIIGLSRKKIMIRHLRLPYNVTQSDLRMALAYYFQAIQRRQPEQLSLGLQRSGYYLAWLNRAKLYPGSGVRTSNEAHNTDRGIIDEIARCKSRWRGKGSHYDHILYNGVPNREANSWMRQQGIEVARLVYAFRFVDDVVRLEDRIHVIRKVNYNLLLIERLKIEHAGHPNDSHGMVTVRRRNEHRYLVIPMSKVRRPVHLVPTDRHKQWYINQFISLEVFNDVY